jgi:hypothetical protein
MSCERKSSDGSWVVAHLAAAISPSTSQSLTSRIDRSYLAIYPKSDFPNQADAYSKAHGNCPGVPNLLA